MISKKELENLYFGELLSIPQIAKKFGLAIGTIQYWMKKHGIPRRTISEAVKGKTKSEDFKRKMKGQHRSPRTEFKKGHFVPKEWKKRLSKLYSGKKRGIMKEETKQKISGALKGKHNSPTTMFRKGYTVPKEWKEKISKFFKGRKLSEEVKSKIRKSHLRGEKHPFWKGGITPLNKKIRDSLEYNEWRKKVFERDNYTCQKCGLKGGRLEVHHIKPFSQFPELRFDMNNAITLCKGCHGEMGGWKMIKC